MAATAKLVLSYFVVRTLSLHSFKNTCQYKMMLTTNTHKFFTENILSLLQRKDIYTVLDFLQQENRVIERYTPLTYPEIIEVKKFLAKTFSAPPINGLTLYEKILSQSALIPTGISPLDGLLKGGFCTGTIYEVCGEADSDMLHIILTFLKNFVCGGNNVYFLDSKRDFSAKFMKTKLAKSRSQKESLSLLKKILLKHVANKFELITVLFDIKRELEEGSAARIIIIHSIPTLFLDSKDYTLNNNMLNHFANILRYLSVEHQTMIIITNLITTWAETDFQSYSGAKEKIACGKYWRGVPNVRIKVDKKHETHFEISLLKHNNVFSSEKCVVNIDVFE